MRENVCVREGVGSESGRKNGTEWIRGKGNKKEKKEYL